MKNLRPSEKLSHWLEQQIHTLAPATRLPTAAALAKQWALSQITVKRILKKFKDAGRLDVIQGSGIYTPSSSEIPASSPPQSLRADEALTEKIFESIQNGKFKIGDMLPSVKFLSIQYKTSHETVGKAYRALIERGYAYKAGKNYWVGGRDEFLNSARRNDLVVFTEQCPEEVYTDPNIFTRPWMAYAYRRAEHELHNYGFKLNYYTYRDFSPLARKWVRSGNGPVAILLHAINGNALQAIAVELRQLVNDLHITFFIDWLHGDPRQLPETAAKISRGNIQTSITRLLAHRTAMAGYACVRYHFNENMQNDIRYIYRALRFRNDMVRHNDAIDFKIAFTPSSPGITSVAQCVSLITEHLPLEELDRRIDSTGTCSRPRFDELLMVVSKPDQAYCAGRKKTLNIFVEDKQAVAALAHLRARKVSIPAQCGIVSLENNARFYHERISCCILDWERTGYLMAHAIVGDIDIEKSSLGFLRMPAVFIDRGTF